MIHPWVVRTPFTPDQIATWKDAQAYFKELAESMGIQITWYKGRGRVKDEKRYHFWLINDERDALAFYLARGDEITQHGQRGKK
jgi:hypothetical protein